MKKNFLLIIAISLPVLLIAAVHPTSILRTPTSQPAPGAFSQKVPFTRIFRAPAVLLETGLELPDSITNMVFDPDGILWLASLNSGPYLYSIRTNELTNLVLPESIYNLFPSNEGVWVLTRERASLYQSGEITRQIRFPEGVSPQAGLECEGSLFFGTTDGLFEAKKSDSEPHKLGISTAVHTITSHHRGLLLSTDTGLIVWNSGGAKSFLSTALLHGNGIFSSVLSSDDGIFVASDQGGILELLPRNWQHVQFARRNLNLNSSNSAVLYRDEPWFGTLDGSIVFRSDGNWRWISVSEFPVTALATDGKSLFAWSGGKLLEIMNEEQDQKLKIKN